MPSQPVAGQQYTLPDLISMCPFETGINPYYETVGPQSSAWIDSYGLLRDRKRAFFILGNSELLSAHTYPYADAESYRTCCDFINLLFALDEISDCLNGEGALRTGRTFLNVFTDEKWDDGTQLAKSIKAYRERFCKRAGPLTYKRYVNRLSTWVIATSKEAEYRTEGRVLDIEEYEALRRENSGVKTCLELFGYVTGIDVPDEVYNNPTFMRMYDLSVDMVTWSNDLYSYNNEQSKGLDGNNILTVLMTHRKMTLQQASDYVGVQFKKIIDEFEACRARLPSWGPKVDAEAAQFIRAMEHWGVGNLHWSFASQRYFGAVHDQVKKTLVVTLQPKEDNEL